MTPAELRLFTDLVGVLAGTFTAAGHTAQVVAHEHRGICSWRRCSAICIERQRLLVEATELLERELGAPAQIGLFEEAASLGCARDVAAPARAVRGGEGAG